MRKHHSDVMLTTENATVTVQSEVQTLLKARIDNQINKQREEKGRDASARRKNLFLMTLSVIFYTQGDTIGVQTCSGESDIDRS